MTFGTSTALELLHYNIRLKVKSPGAATKLDRDFRCGSGLRADFANTVYMPACRQINLSAGRIVRLPGLGRTNLRLAMINTTDKVCELRNGSGIGVGAPQFGPHRGMYFGFTNAL